MTKRKHPLKDPSTRLKAAIIDLAGEHGADRVTLDGAAKRAKIPFSSAHSLLKKSGMSVLQYGIQEVGENAQRTIAAYIATEQKGNPTKNPLHHYINGTFDWAERFPRHASLWLFQYHTISVNRPDLERHQEFLDTAVSRIEKLIYEGVGRGIYKTVENVSKTATVIHTLLMGATLRALVSARKGSSEEHRVLTIEMVDWLLSQ